MFIYLDIEFCPSVVLVNVYILSFNETVQLKLGPNDTVGMVKAKIHEQLSIPCDEQKLIYAGRVLEDEYKLFEYSIQKNSTLQLLICKLVNDLIIKLNTRIYCYNIYIRTKDKDKIDQ